MVVHFFQMYDATPEVEAAGTLLLSAARREAG